MKQPAWYRKTEEFLLPLRSLTTFLLILIMVVSFAMLFAKSNLVRVSWVTYVFMP